MVALSECLRIPPSDFLGTSLGGIEVAEGLADAAPGRVCPGQSEAFLASDGCRIDASGEAADADDGRFSSGGGLLLHPEVYVLPSCIRHALLVKKA